MAVREGLLASGPGAVNGGALKVTDGILHAVLTTHERQLVLRVCCVGSSFMMPWAAAAAAASAVLPHAPSSEPCEISFFCETVPSRLPCGSLTCQSI